MSALDPTRIRQARDGRRLGVPLVYREHTGSTNDDAMEFARQGAEEGTTVLADHQTRGRGRLGRRWESPPGRNVYLSVILRPSMAATMAPQLTLVAGVAVVETIRAWLPEAVLKWPNDVLVRGKKVAGVLVEMAARGEQVDFAVVGVGINVNMASEDFPSELRELAGSMAEALGQPIDRNEVVITLLQKLEEEYEAYLQHGFEWVRTRWWDRAGMAGQRVSVNTGLRRLEGEAVGLDERGALQLRVGEEIVAIVAGDVTIHGSGAACS